MKVFVNVYTLKGAQKHPFALAYSSQSAAEEHRQVRNDDLVFRKRLEVDIAECQRCGRTLTEHEACPCWKHPN